MVLSTASHTRYSRSMGEIIAAGIFKGMFASFLLADYLPRLPKHPKGSSPTSALRKLTSSRSSNRASSKYHRRPRLACADAPYSSAIEALAATDYWGHRLPDIQSSSRWTLSRKVLLTSSPRKFSCLTSVGFSRISALIPFAQPVHD